MRRLRSLKVAFQVVFFLYLLSRQAMFGRFLDTTFPLKRAPAAEKILENRVNETSGFKAKAPKLYTVDSTNHSVSIIITSSLIPTHPSLGIINTTITSLSLLHGLPKETPIYVTVDGLNPSRRITPPKMREDYAARRVSYIKRLQLTSFPPFTNIVVLPMPAHQQIAGSVNQAILHIMNTSLHAQLYPQNHLLYVLQHDLPFVQPVSHTELVQALREYPEDLRNIRFRYDRGIANREYDQRRFPPCLDVENGTDFKRNGLPFFATSTWSDNNQISSLQYYVEMMNVVYHHRGRKILTIPMELAMMEVGRVDCTKWGQRVYGNRSQRLSYLDHLDGKRSTSTR